MEILKKLPDALAEMTALCIETEHKRAEAEKRADEWYNNFLRKDQELRHAKDRLVIEMKEHKKLREKAGCYMDSPGEPDTSEN